MKWTRFANNPLLTILIDNSLSPPKKRAPTLFIMTLWFGLLAGWLELGTVQVSTIVHPHVSVSTLRTNRHLPWMIPVSNALIFSVAGLLITLLAHSCPRQAQWLALRLPIVMLLLATLLAIEGLYAIACVILACGIAYQLGTWLEQKIEPFRRLLWASLPTMVVGFAVMTGLSYGRIASSELRALSQIPAAKPGSPNVLFIVLDTVRATCLSLYGHYRPTTPNLERLASRGLVFTEARSPAPWTSPAHASMMTGRWPHELSVAPGVPLDGTFPTLAEALAQEGYATAGFVGNIYYCNALYGIDRGFARYEDAYENQTVSLFETFWSSSLGKRIIRGLGYSTQFDDGKTLLRKSAAMLNHDVLNWLSKRPSDRPFFAFINYYDAHRPYELEGKEPSPFGMAALPTAERRKIEERLLKLVAEKPDPTDVSLRWIEEEGLNLYHDSYDSCIAYIDHQVGLLLDEIERQGLLQNTLVIITSDHGEQLGEHGLITHGSSVYREEVHVPLLVIPPTRSSSAKVVKEPVSLREIPATVAEWTGLSARSPFPGRSLTRFLHETLENQAQSQVLSELQHNIAFPGEDQIPPAYGPVRSLVSRDRVYIRKDDGREELYDLLLDPLETVDIAKAPESQPDLDRFRRELNQLRPDVTATE